MDTIEIGKSYFYKPLTSEKHPSGLPVIVKEIRTSMSGEKIPYVERQDGSGQSFTCPMGDLADA
jgi:hypothetical protein